MKIPFSTHTLNFLVKYILFVIVFIVFQYLNLISISSVYLAILPLAFTLIGVIADWVIVPKFHNIVGGSMGAIFMGSTTFLLGRYYDIGNIPFLSAVALAFSLGIVEVTLHRLIVKPYLKKA